MGELNRVRIALSVAIVALVGCGGSAPPGVDAGSGGHAGRGGAAGAGGVTGRGGGAGGGLGGQGASGRAGAGGGVAGAGGFAGNVSGAAGTAGGFAGIAGTAGAGAGGTGGITGPGAGAGMGGAAGGAGTGGNGGGLAGTVGAAGVGAPGGGGAGIAGVAGGVAGAAGSAGAVAGGAGSGAAGIAGSAGGAPGTGGGVAGAGGTTALTCWAVGDFDGDGIADCVRKQGPSSSPSWDDLLFNKGVASRLYETTTITTAGVLPSMADLLFMFDLNDDGRQDLLLQWPDLMTGTSVPGTQRFDFIAGNADGTFSPYIPAGGWPSNWSSVGVWEECDATAAGTVNHVPPNVGDFDGDGRLDILSLAYSSHSLYSAYQWLVATSTGGTNFQIKESTAISSSRQGPAISAVIDLNHDQRLDVVGWIPSSSNTGPSYAASALGNGDGTFRPFSKVPGSDGTTGISSVSDVNGDGNVDLVVGLAAGKTTFYGDGAGNFSATPPP